MGRTVAGDRSRWLGSDCEELGRLSDVPPGVSVGAVIGLGTARLRLANVLLLAMLAMGASSRGAEALARERGRLVALRTSLLGAARGLLGVDVELLSGVDVGLLFIVGVGLLFVVDVGLLFGVDVGLLGVAIGLRPTVRGIGASWRGCVFARERGRALLLRVGWRGFDGSARDGMRSSESGCAPPARFASQHKRGETVCVGSACRRCHR